MDNFINLAKVGYSTYQASHSDVSKTGGQEYNSPHHSGQQGGEHGPRFDHDEVVRTAESHGSGESSLFSNAMGFISSNQHAHNEEVDEDKVQEAHHKAYSQNGGSDLSAHDMGGAAALQALKSFTSGGGGGGSTQLISLAMAEATKLFDKSGGAASGNKQDVVNGAAMTVMKLLVQSKMGGSVGGGNSGGLGSLMGLASKFL
ncbi:beta-flanking protein [Phlegmacium glaucopus]|nr:beta-flanking protein [Phlegmacium glaucopus]